jgi:hypothetical protein
VFRRWCDDCRPGVKLQAGRDGPVVGRSLSMAAPARARSGNFPGVPRQIEPGKTPIRKTGSRIHYPLDKIGGTKSMPYLGTDEPES